MRKFLLCFLLFFSGAVAGAPRDYLKLIDFPHPYCRSELDLDFAGESFVEIGNALAGRDEYNEVVRAYTLNNEADYVSKSKRFRRVYEHSPLIEALDFLELQRDFDVAKKEKENKGAEFEQRFRGLTLKYPKSTLIPVLTGGLAYYYLSQGNYVRALHFYQKARKEHPFHAMQCLYMAGTAEANYLLGMEKQATSTFELVINKCDNPRLEAGARLRLADMAWKNNRVNEAATRYRKLIQDEVESIARLYPTAWYHLGEILYRKKKFNQAEGYFKRFTEFRSAEALCRSFAKKRVADIALHRNEPTKEVVTKYLMAREYNKTNEVGRFSYIQALFLEFEKDGRAEMGRRIQIFEENIDFIELEEMRKAAFLQKGLVLLDQGERAAVDYLVRLDEKTRIKLRKGKLAPFLQSRLLRILEKEAAHGTSDQTEKKMSEPKLIASQMRENQVLKNIKEAYEVWLEGSRFEAKAKRLYGKIRAKRVMELLAANKTEQAIQYLKNWKKDPFVKASSLQATTRDKAAFELFKKMRGAKEPEKLALLFSEEKGVIEPLTRGEFSDLWLTVALELDDLKSVQRQLNKKGRRTPASIPVSEDFRDFLKIQEAQALMKLKRYTQADRVFSRLKTKAAKQSVLKDRLVILKETKKYGKAYGVAKQLYKKAPKEDKASQLLQMKGLVERGKLWARAGETLVFAEKLKLEDKEIGPYFFLAGKARYEQKKCKDAVSKLERALVLSPELTEAAEARFSMAKCYLRLRKQGQAKKVLEDLSAMNDPFWSSLAKNELTLLRTKR